MSFNLNGGRWYNLDLQPESWEVGTAFASRRNGSIRGGLSPSAKVQAFESAVREELEASDPEMMHGDVTIILYLWRQLGKGIEKSDATNMQKAIEDAMQGVLIENDRQVRSISTEIMEQDVLTSPRIMIFIAPYEQTKLPSFVYNGEVNPNHQQIAWGDEKHYTDGVF